MELKLSEKQIDKFDYNAESLKEIKIGSVQFDKNLDLKNSQLLNINSRRRIHNE